MWACILSLVLWHRLDLLPKLAHLVTLVTVRWQRLNPTPKYPDNPCKRSILVRIITQRLSGACMETMALRLIVLHCYLHNRDCCLQALSGQIACEVCNPGTSQARTSTSICPSQFCVNSFACTHTFWSRFHYYALHWCSHSFTAVTSNSCIHNCCCALLMHANYVLSLGLFLSFWVILVCNWFLLCSFEHTLFVKVYNTWSIGWYMQGKPGQTMCVDCAAGTYQTGTAKSDCTPCPENTYNVRLRTHLSLCRGPVQHYHSLGDVCTTWLLFLVKFSDWYTSRNCIVNPYCVCAAPHCRIGKLHKMCQRLFHAGIRLASTHNCLVYGAFCTSP